MNKSIILIIALWTAPILWTQDVDKKIYNWYNGKKYGMQTDKAYGKTLKGKTSKPVIVAVIDSGVDIEHEDLQGKIWVNKNEIPNNGIDDDNNGYIDDINGWNFLGNANGENLNNVRLEVTRIYAELKDKYEGKSATDLSDSEQDDYQKYIAVRTEVKENQKRLTDELKGLEDFTENVKKADEDLRAYFQGDYTEKQLLEAISIDELAEAAVQIYTLAFFGMDYDGYFEYLAGIENELNYNYNPDVNPRATIIGDDVSDFNDKSYGNNDITGPDAGHGTHCAGIIGAIRGNEIGNDGIANNVLIMSIRAVPNGDEWDKDIANAVRYAVDNGAEIINMSFGKAYSPQQEGVIEAFRYAEENGVLLIHAAGNESNNNDELGHNFPSPIYPGMNKKFSNWIEVGASTRYKKAKLKKDYVVHEGLAAEFSNYGNEIVDVFAPGHDIYSTTPDNSYSNYSGTSMAGPMVAGTAALLKSYYPQLTCLEIKSIILKSVKNVGKQKTLLPGSEEEFVPFSELSVTGGIVNVYNAVQLAEEITNP